MRIHASHTSRCRPLVLAVAIAVVPTGMLGQAAPAVDGAELYRSACAACHGADGRGAPPARLGFETPVPDFTSCSFATREPDADWWGIVHAGGPVRGFDRMMPAFGGALSADEINRILGYVRGFCRDRSWPRGELNLPRPFFVEKAYPEDEAVLTIGAPLRRSVSWEAELLYERRFGARNQIELVVPIAARERGPGDWTAGVGDIAIGLKRAVHHSLATGRILSVGGEVVLPTGNARQGLGTGSAVVEPFVAFGQILPAESFVQLQAGLELPTDRDLDNEAFWRMAIGRSYAASIFGRSWTPMLEVLGARDLAERAETAWDLVPQLQLSLNKRQHVLANVGIRLPVTHPDRPRSLVVYLLWDWFDGRLWDGW